MSLIDFFPLTFLEPRHPRPYNSNRHSQIYHPDIAELPTGDPEPYSFIPLVLDPTPPAALPSSSYRADTSSGYTTPRHERPAPSRTTSNASQTASELDAERDRYDAPGRKPVPTSQPPQNPPHIAYQEKGRQPSLPTAAEMGGKPVEKQSQNTSTEANPYPSRTSSKSVQPDISINLPPTKNTSTERCYSENKQGWDNNFKFGDIPKRPDTAASITNVDDITLSSSSMWTTQDGMQKHTDNPPDSPGKYSSIFSITVSNSSGNTTLEAAEPTSSIPRKEVPPRDTPSEKKPDLPPRPSPRPDLPSRPSPRSNVPGHKFSHSETLSSSSLANALTDAPLLSLPLRTPGTDFSQDEDIARILGSDASSSALLRKVSAVVRHGRSFSDLAGMVLP